MAADPLQIRIARLEGGFEQIDKRMSSLEGALRDLRAEFAAFRGELHEEIQRVIARVDHVDARVDMVLYGLVVAILVPIFLRVFFR